MLMNSAAAAAVAMALAPPVWAQAPATDSEPRLSEIVVTARMRAESLQDVPLTITALTAQKIQSAGISNIQELTAFTPGFHFDNTGSRQGSSIRIRGLDINTANPTRQNASFFIDGVYYPGTVQSINFADLERVEVIKGPQSALFGRQTFGGAVNFITKDPSPRLTGTANATVAEDGYREVTGGVSIPVVADKLFVRLSGRSYDFDGVFRNSVDGAKLGRQESRSYSATVIARPADWLELKVRYIGSEDDDGQAAVAQLGINDLNCTPVAGKAKFFCGEIPPVPRFALNTVAAPNALGISEFGFRRNADLYTASATANFSGFTLTASYGGYRDKNVDVGDLDLTGIPRFGTATFQRFKDDSGEIRLVSPGDKRLRFVVGAYVYDGRFESTGFTSGSFSVLGGNLALFPATGSPDVAEASNRAVFGSVSFDLPRDVTASLELRAQEDEVSNTGGTGAARRTLSGKTRTVLPRVILDWKPIPEALVYAVFSQGNKPRQFNANIAGLTDAQRTFIKSTYGVDVALEEETLDNYEVGLKTTAMNGLLTANLALYRMEWNNQITRAQVFRSQAEANAQTGQINAVAAAGSSRIQGAEFEGSVRPTERLIIEATLAYTNAKYTSFNSVNNEQVFGVADAGGSLSPRFPKWAGSVGAAYTLPLANDWRATIRADAAYKGQRYTDEVNLAYAGGYWNTDARLTLNNDRFRVSAFVENLFDTDAVVGASRFRDISVPGNAFSFPYQLLEPRRFGVTAGVSF